MASCREIAKNQNSVAKVSSEFGEANSFSCTLSAADAKPRSPDEKKSQLNVDFDALFRELPKAGCEKEEQDFLPAVEVVAPMDQDGECLRVSGCPSVMALHTQ